MQVILYSRPQCHLCVEVRDMLDLICDMMDLTYQEIDIHSDDELLEKYQLMIPVVEVDGEFVLSGKFSYSALKKSLEEKRRIN